MADVRKALVEFLKADAGVAALAGTRVYPEAVPMQPSAAYFPRAWFQELGKDMPRTLRGATRQPTVKLALACQAWGATGYAQAQGLAQAVRDATGGVAGGPRLEDWAPARMGATQDVWVCGVRFEDEAADPVEAAPGGEQPRIHTVRLLLVVTYLEKEF